MAGDKERISKDPIVRKNELIDVAERFFTEKGYEETSVNDIIESVGVAKGTFYYYFKSKEDLMDAVIGRQIRQIEMESRSICSDTSLNALQKVRQFVSMAVRFKDDKGALIAFLYSDKNHLLRERYFARMNELQKPFLVSVIEQGVKEGVFDIQYPKETVELMLILMSNVFTRFIDPTDNVETLYKKLRALESAFERLLGAQRGSISLMF